METQVLTRDAILGANDLEKEIVEVPEWGGSVMVRSMNAKQRDSLEIRMMKDHHDIDGLRALMAIWCVVDGNGKNLFTMEDFDALCEKSAVALDRVFPVAQRLSKLTKEDVAELVKNLDAAQSGDSSSDSVSLSE